MATNYGVSFWSSGGGGGGGGAGGVTSLNAETGDVVIVAGTNITVTPSGQNITIASSPGTTGNLTDAGTDGITVTGGTGAVLGSGTSIAQHVADATHNGYLLNTDWVSFNAKQSALTIGNLTDAGTDGITVTGGTGAVIGSGTSISQHVADATHNGYLLSTDWVSFNGKGSGTVTTTGSPASGNLTKFSGASSVTNADLTGDVTTSGGVATTLATVNSNVGSFTNASLTVNAKGLVTAASSGSAPVTAVSVATANGLAGSSSGTATPTLTLSTTITGVLKGNGTAISAATSGTDYSAGTSALATGILKSTTTTGALTIAVSGTDYAPGVLTTKGDLYGFSSVNARIPIGTDTYVLTADSSQTLGLKWALPSSSPRSSVTVSNGNGQGSTNTKIRRWTNIRLNTGTDITYADSATLGGSFTVNTAGVYTISCSDGASSSTVLFGITVNNSAPTTDIASLTYAQGVRATVQTGSAAETGFVSWTGILAANDVLQMAGGGSPVPDETSTARSICTVTKVSN